MMCAVTVCLAVLVLSTCCLIPPSFSRSIVSRRFCDAGQYLDVQRDTCRNCSTTCPQNQIIRRTCSPIRDTVCGPFFEFRPQFKDAEKNREMQRQRLHQLLQQQYSLRRQEGTDWSLSANDTDAEYSGPFGSLPPPPPPEAESDVKRMCCWTSVACLGILISASLLCLIIVAMVILLFRRRFLRGRKSLSGAIPGAGVVRLRTHDHVTFPRVLSSSLTGSVDKRVKHLELQLHRNWQRRGGAGAGGMTPGSQLIGGNDYVNEKLRKALIWNTNTAI